MPPGPPRIWQTDRGTSCWRQVPRSYPPSQRSTRRGSTRAFCRRWQVSQHARQRAFRTAISLRCTGPFTKELNAALLHQFHIDYMVTKDGGAAGGFAEKAEAAARCGVQLIVLRRPDDEGETSDTILQRCRELL